jgi:cell wall-associated NlpC family hydrolase
MLDTALVPVAVVLASTGVSHAPAPPPAPGVKAARIARTYIDTPYVWAGASRRGVDCSGLVVAVYRSLGVELPHQSNVLWQTLPRVKRLRKGDILAFGSGDTSDHVGIYLGDGRFIGASGASRGVRIGRLSARDDLLGAVRPRLKARRKVRQAVQQPRAVLRLGQWIHDGDAQGRRLVEARQRDMPTA